MASSYSHKVRFSKIINYPNTKLHELIEQVITLNLFI